jgi:cobalamin biosynthesis Mg chelatase CobN
MRIGVVISECPDAVMMDMILNPAADVTHTKAQIAALYALLAAKNAPTTTVASTTSAAPTATALPTTTAAQTTTTSTTTTTVPQTTTDISILPTTTVAPGGDTGRPAIGVVVGAAAGVAAIGCLWFLIARRRKRQVR